MGVRLVAYIDDTLILETKDLVQDHSTEIVECLEFIINRVKSILNLDQIQEFLGLTISSPKMELRLSLNKTDTSGVSENNERQIHLCANTGMQETSMQLS